MSEITFTHKIQLVNQILDLPGVIAISDEASEWQAPYDAPTQTLLLRIDIRVYDASQPPTLGISTSDATDLDEKVG